MLSTLAAADGNDRWGDTMTARDSNKVTCDAARFQGSI